jgi:hypothetical protein
MPLFTVTMKADRTADEKKAISVPYILEASIRQDNPDDEQS